MNKSLAVVLLPLALLVGCGDDDETDPNASTPPATGGDAGASGDDGRSNESGALLPVQGSCFTEDEFDDGGMEACTNYRGAYFTQSVMQEQCDGFVTELRMDESCPVDIAVARCVRDVVSNGQIEDFQYRMDDDDDDHQTALAAWERLCDQLRGTYTRL